MPEILSGTNKRMSSGEKGWDIWKLGDYAAENSIGMPRPLKSGRASSGDENLKGWAMSIHFGPRETETRTVGAAFKNCHCSVLMKILKLGLQTCLLHHYDHKFLEDRSEIARVHSYSTHHNTGPCTQSGLQDNCFNCYSLDSEWSTYWNGPW